MPTTPTIAELVATVEMFACVIRGGWFVTVTLNCF